MKFIILPIVYLFLGICCLDGNAVESSQTGVVDQNYYQNKIQYLYKQDDFSHVTKLMQNKEALSNLSIYDDSEDSEDNTLEPIEQLTNFLINLNEIYDGKTLFEYAYRAALQIRSQLDVHQPSLIVGIGRSPFLLIDLLDNILSFESYSGQTKLKHMAFSGSADIWFAKGRSKMESNKMTHTRLDVIFSYFDELGFNQADQGIWFIDIMGFGCGKNSLFRLLREYYFRRNLTQPPIHFLLLADYEKRVLEEKEYVLTETYIYFTKTRVTEFLSFYRSYGILPMEIPTTPIYCPTNLIDIIDDHFFATLCAPIQQYKPIQMVPGSEEWRSQPSKYYALFKQVMTQGILYLRGHPKVNQFDLAIYMLESLVDNQEWIDTVFNKSVSSSDSVSITNVQSDRNVRLNFLKMLYSNGID